jgi:Zn-dependent protease with chaperone function
MRVVHRCLSLAVASALVVGCASTTKGGSVGADRRQLLLVSGEQVDQMAVQAYQGALGEAQKAKKLNTDAPMVKRVRAVAARLIPQVGVFRPDALQWKWEVNVIESDELNAWCMQGGKIAVYTGIVNKLKLTDDELAAIMGHEMSHALREHSREQISQSMATQLGVNVGAALLGLGAVAGDLINTGANLMLTLPNSRQGEREADRMGVELAARAGYDPRAAVNVWKKMAAFGAGSQPPAWLSTHPSHAERTADLTRYAGIVMPLYAKAKGG